ncbi:branched-chain amino acid ABC transporter permease [Nocardioides zeae]|uniref:Branched-chain amino acid ABC transporter permease n=1 Tax=Nocardioides imazamoxiresistens TaxID=3231893 RepID=A0ABU3PQY5_9ACTN|nr:branched-chain amino acid ABC transporter permease [Nocardioides zeae]MDT9591639.1 branched-chain amino acid ABC transporter permease [Nocardioides zeae]
MQDFLQLAVTGTALGSVYALIAVGFVLIYKSTGQLNFAQGDVMAMGAFLVYWFGPGRFELSFAFAVLLALVGTCAFMVFVEFALVRRLAAHSHEAVLIGTLGLGILIRAALTAGFGTDKLGIGDPWGSSTTTLLGVSVTTSSLWAIAVTGIIIGALTVWFRSSRAGVSVVAMSQDPVAAAALGVNTRRMTVIVWAIAGALAVVAGIFLAGYPRGIDPHMGLIALAAFPGAVLGGFDSINGAVVGAVTIGIVQTLVAGYEAPWAGVVGHNFHVIVPWLVLVVVLLVRPQGLFGTKRVIRA